MKQLRELPSNGVRCRWNPDMKLGMVYSEKYQKFEYANADQYLDHAAVFTALRAQPYAPEVDHVAELIEHSLSFTNGWKINDEEYTRLCKKLSSTIRPLVLASVTVDALVDEFIRRGAIYYPATQRTWDGYPRLVLSAAECRPSAMPSTSEPTR